MKLKKKWMITTSLFLVVVMLGIGGYLLSQNNKDNQSITFIDKNTVEYGDTTVSSKQLVVETTGRIVTYPKINVMQVGKQTLVYVVKNGDVIEEILHEITVKDTQKPKIELSEDSISIALNMDFHPAANISSVKDSIDGNLQYLKKSKKGSYTVFSDVDTSTLGEYNVIVTAIDKNGNESIKKFKVKVEKKLL